LAHLGIEILAEGAMRANRPAELVMGSVQLGLAYGAANRSGKPARETALKLVRRAADAGVTQFDTARSYGDAEERLGDALASRRSFTITKLSPLAELEADASRERVRAAVDASIRASCAALKRQSLDCLLLHRASHMTAFDGAVWRRLIEHLKDGKIAKLGVSVQSPAEALEALSRAQVEHIQLPFNVLDWRWHEAGVIDVIRARAHLTVHARSIFLQGILATRDASLWPRIVGVDARSVVAWLDETARDYSRESPADLCLAFARGQDWIDGVVVGQETSEQLDANLRLATRPPLSAQDCARIEAARPRMPVEFLDPAQWPTT
jgi:aryl-alcohol dehydrogenase-like predicted oxidoreductase